MKYAIIDTETSSLFDFSKPADAEGQPRLASLAIICADENLDISSNYSIFIKPDGWMLGDEAAKVNGLTMDFLNERGIPVIDAIDIYAGLIDQGYVIVAFNAAFDCKMMRGEMRRAGVDDRFEQTKNICTMRSLTPICQIPNKTGKGFKLPKLAEAMAHFDMVNDGPHSAAGDAMACLQLLRKLKDMDKMPTPMVFYSKNRE